MLRPTLLFYLICIIAVVKYLNSICHFSMALYSLCADVPLRNCLLTFYMHDNKTIRVRLILTEFTQLKLHMFSLVINKHFMNKLNKAIDYYTYHVGLCLF